MTPSFILSLSFLALRIKLSSSEVIFQAKSLLRTQEFGYAAFVFHPNSKLHGEVTFKAYVEHPKQCALGCARNFNCLSFNFGTQPVFFLEKIAYYICELLPNDKYVSWLLFESVNQEFNHYSIRTNCRKFPCHFNFTCVANYTEDTYECLCPRPPYEGRDCKDADKCASGQHNCSVNATCANTIGSYNCTCKNGYLGDGKTCNKTQSVSAFQESVILRDYGNSSYFTALERFMSEVPEDITSTPWIRCWSGRQDGWDVFNDFHKQCDNKGPTVTIVRKEKYIWGGYTDVPWTSNYGFKASTTSFIFSLFNINEFSPIKFALIQTNNAVMHDINKGPTFGTVLTIGNDAATSTMSHNMYNGAYAAPPDCAVGGKCNFFTGLAIWYTIDDIEVFYKNTV